VNWLRVVVPFALAALELSHPVWADGSVARAVVAAGAWWIPLHLLLIGGYVLLVWTLWPARAAPDASREPARLIAAFSLQRMARALLTLFALANTAFLAVDGPAIGILAPSDPSAAETLWTSPLVTLLANASGAAWSAALLTLALALLEADSRLVVAGLALTWLTFVASAVVPQATAASRLVALATGAAAVYSTGKPALTFALLVFAAVLRQHVGPEAALGMLCIAAAQTLRGRSVLEASSRL
jgi:hypothetical protein